MKFKLSIFSVFIDVLLQNFFILLELTARSFFKMADSRSNSNEAPYAKTYGSEAKTEKLINQYSKAAAHAHNLGLGVNAGHDLDLSNLGLFLKQCNIDEVSIGHALISDSLKFGMSETVKKYLHLCK